MRPGLVFPILALVASCVTACDLMTDVDGPRPEDFASDESTSEVRQATPAREEELPDVRQDVTTRNETVHVAD